MVNRIKTWIPPTIPLRDNLPAWKLICNDIHDNLLLAGLVQTDDTGQLDIDAVSVLPADNTYAGYRMYRFNDPLQATYPILIRLDFGCGVEGLYDSARSRTLNIKTVIGTNTNGNGDLLGVKSIEYKAPQSINLNPLASNSQLTNSGISYLSYNESNGSFVFLYGVGSRNKPFSNSYGYYGCSLAIFIQRTKNLSGELDGTGLACFGCDLTFSMSSWISSNYPNFCYYSSIYQIEKGCTRVSTLTDVLNTSNLLMPLVGTPGTRAFGAEVGLQPIYMQTPYLQTWPSVFTYYADDIPEGSIIDVNGTNFMTIGRDTGIIPDNRNLWNTGLAIIWEGDIIP